jgi:phage tail-like protein
VSAVLPPVAGPPHDPLFTLLSARAGWRLSSCYSVDDRGEIELLARTDTDLPLASGDGTFAGLTPPTGQAATAEGLLYRTDLSSSSLLLFNPCKAEYEAVGHTGATAAGVRNLLRPRGIAAFCGRLYICDSGNRRIVVFLADSLHFSGQWMLPDGAAWEPFAITFSSHGIAFVSDSLNDVVHVFNSRGNYLLTITEVVRPRHLTLDAASRLYVVQDGLPEVVVFSEDGQRLREVRWLSEVREAFGCSIEIPDPRQFYQRGSAMTSALDSRIDDCIWHRVIVHGHVPRGTRIVLQTSTSNQPLPPESDPAEDTGWTTLPAVEAIPQQGWDALITSEPGRYLWLRILLFGTGEETPQISAIRLEYPRISLRRWLPAVFGAVSKHADFTDRFLAIFDTQFRSLEASLDRFSRCLDPGGAPATRDADWLGWIAGWLGIELDRTWPEPRRREWLRQASLLYHRRGTPEGLRRHLLILLGWQNCEHAPQLILEHFRLRQWLTVGASRLGHPQQLWGRALLSLPTPVPGCQDDAKASGEKALLETLAAGGPAATYSQSFTVFVPAAALQKPEIRVAVERVIALHTPAHVHVRLRSVGLHGTIGRECVVGLSTVIGALPAPKPLTDGQLRRNLVLQGANRGDPPTTQVGRQSRIGIDTRVQ